MPKRCKVDHNFFGTWTPAMAYVLGFFAADGTMTINARGAHYVAFHVTDLTLLQDIRRLMSSEHKIAVRVRDTRWKLGYRIQVGSKQLCHDLAELGFTPNKSCTMHMPHVPRALLGEYVRGYFDGDGCVYFNVLRVKARKNPKPILQTKFTSGSEAYLREFLVALRTRGIQGGYIVKKQRSGYDLTLSHRDSLAIYRLMYNNTPTCGVWLERKKLKFGHAVQTMYAGVA